VRHPLLFATALLCLVGCDAANGPGQGKSPLPPRAAQPPVRPALPDGPAVAVAALPVSTLQDAAAVSQLALVPAQNAKLFSVSGGDPAANGLVTYLALFAGPAGGWRVYPVGDFESWRLVETRPGEFVLKVREMGQGGSGPLTRRDRRIIIAFTFDGDTHPASITVTPAR
jgi:hypothetical protein